jgi:hypothetical protein
MNLLTTKDIGNKQTPKIAVLSTSGKFCENGGLELGELF